MLMLKRKPQRPDSNFNMCASHKLLKRQTGAGNLAVHGQLTGKCVALKYTRHKAKYKNLVVKEQQLEAIVAIDDWLQFSGGFIARPEIDLQCHRGNWHTSVQICILLIGKELLQAEGV